MKGIEKLTEEQKLVLFEKLKSELGKARADIQTNPDDTCRTVQRKEFEKITRVMEVTDKPDAEISCCVHCGSVSIIKHGFTSGNIQRYRCKDCKKTFNANYGLITHYTHLSAWQWEEIIRGTVEGLSTTEIAKNIQTTPKTAWLGRMKIFQTIKNIYGYCDTFNNIVEADGKYERLSFKGKRNKEFFLDTLGRMPRHHRSKEERITYIGKDKYRQMFMEKPRLLKEMIYSSQKRMVGRDTIDIKHQHVCIITAIDRSNNIYIEPVTLGVATSMEVYNKLHGRISNEAVLITDDHHSYKYFFRKDRIEHVAVPGGTYINGTYSLARINSLHASMDRFLGGKEYKPATKYLDLYMMMFWWFQKNRDLSAKEKYARLMDIMTGKVSMEARAKMKRITFNELVSRELPINTKGLFPTKE